MGDDRPPRFSNPRLEQQNHISSRIMQTTVITVFFVVIIVVLIATCVLRRQARRRSAIRQFSLEVATAQLNASEPPKNGLEPSVIASLPIFVYKQADRVNEPALECAVCLSAFDEGEEARLLPNCKHSFHLQCIDMWLDSHSTCPICRTGAEPRERKELGDPGAAAVACSEGTSEAASGLSSKASGSSSRLSSFRRMLSRERSERRSQARGQGDGGEDIENREAVS